MKPRKLKKPNYPSMYIQIAAYSAGGFISIWMGDEYAFLVFVAFLLVLIFFVYLSLKIIKAGCGNSVKTIINALWNLETAGAFVYGVYTFIRYKLIEHNDAELMISYVKNHPHFFYSMLIILVVTVMFRAALSFAELITFDANPAQEKKPSVINCSAGPTDT